MADSTTDDPYHATQQPEPEPENRPVPSPSSLPPSAHPNPISNLSAPPPPSVQPSFRAAVPQFSAINYHYQMLAPPTYALAGQPIRYAPPLMPNGYPAIPQPPGIFRYPSPYAPMIRPAYPLQLLVGVMPPLARLPVVGIHGPIVPPVVRPFAIASVTSKDKPQTTVYIGKISSTVENDFMLSLLQLCGPVKNWKRPQDPTGTLKGFGFCEFESAEGVLRALRLLSKLSVDGQKLMVNVNQTTREYLELYVEKKMESSKNIEGSETEGTENMEISTLGANTNESVKSPEESTKPSLDEQKDDSESSNKVIDAANFGLVTDEDREADCDAIEKLTGMIEERLKSKPLPPPSPRPKTPVDGLENSEQPSGSRDWKSDGDVAKNDSENKNEDDKTAESKPSNDNDRTEPGSPDRSRRHDRSRDLDLDLKRDKEKELERYEREREQERTKRERERNYKSVEDERRYNVHEKEWETRERERDHWQKREQEREKESAQERKWKIMDQERDSDDCYGKKRKFKSSCEDRKRRLREKKEDLADRLREEEQISEAKIRAEEEQQKKLYDALNVISGQPANGHDKAALLSDTNSEDMVVGSTFDNKQSREIYEGKGVVHNGISDESAFSSDAASDTQQISNAPTRKLGFGLSGSGQRAAVPSVFNEDEDEDARKEKKMRPLVPIDYSEEQQAVQPSISERPPATVVAAAEDVNHISTLNTKEEKYDVGKERGRHSHERSSHRDRHRHEEETSSTREESRKNNFGRVRANKVKAPEKQKLLDAKQLIDTIPKTKDELFSYEINWVIFDQNALHERMKSWISKKITDFLGEEEVTLVDYIVSSTQEHVDAGEMLERLQTILDDEAELFVLKMWRMLIFEIKKVETGLAPRPMT